jgi:hypothetical protein
MLKLGNHAEFLKNLELKGKIEKVHNCYKYKQKAKKLGKKTIISSVIMN